MKVAILGGGFTGLTAAFKLAKAGHTVTLIEKEQNLGGLAAGFTAPGWEWSLERAYHHLFSNDLEILNFARETGFQDILLESPQTASLYKVPRGVKEENGNNYRNFPVDTPQDFLRLPLLSWPAKFRAGCTMAYFKIAPYGKYLDTITAVNFLKRGMGEEAWNVLFEQMFRKKFGKYAEKIVAAFIWARVKKRSKKLAYIKGGFQTFINHLEKVNKDAGVTLKKGVGVVSIATNSSLELTYDNGKKERFDRIISTLPTAVIARVGEQVLPASYITQLKKLEYLHAVNVILATEEPLFDRTYWSSVCVPEFPMMVLVQHTNFMDRKHYGGEHLLYIGNYIDRDHPLLKMSDKEALNYFKPALEQIKPGFSKKIKRIFVFKAPFAQPIFDREFVKNKPDFITPVKHLYMANLDMTYPYDRGTNYAVKLGLEVAEMVNSS